MRHDRIIQLGALAGAIACAGLAGSLLPSILDAAGEPYLVVRNIEGGGTTRINVGELREMKTLNESKAADAKPFELTFDTGAREWKGAFGDSVKFEYIKDGQRVKLDGVLEGTNGYGLRYTDVAMEGAPPIVALGTMMGALRGLIVDYLWIKVNMMKEKGLFFELMADSDLITKLQPRFGEVWGFHGHNMAYIISVLTNPEEERWACHHT